MTTTTPAESAQAAPHGQRQWTNRRLSPVGRLVDHRLGGPRGLQERYRRNESQGRADVAALRKGAGRAPGELPEIWGLTQVPVSEAAGDAPTREELAVHAAMTLYAVHQQSRTTPVFRPGVGLGSAARQLIGFGDEENPSARARFNALVTSATVAELYYHLRNLVSQLRSRDIGLDHAMLADDLVRFQRPGGAKSVRLTWARQYAALPASPDSASPSEDPSRPTPSTPEN